MSLSRLGVAKRRAPLTIIHISLPSPGLLVDSGAAGPFHVRLAGESASLRLFGPIYPDRSQLRDGVGGLWSAATFVTECLGRPEGTKQQQSGECTAGAACVSDREPGGVGDKGGATAEPATRL